MDSIVLIKIDRKKKSTARSYSTNSPYYNEYFVFEFTSSLENLMDKNITLTVIQPGSIVKKRKTLGYITLDIATVWAQHDHQFFHKWAILTAPQTDILGGTRGYLKVDISIITKGEIPKIPKNISNNEIEGNLLLPEGLTTERQKAKFIIDIYKGEDFYKSSTSISSKSNQQLDNRFNSYIVISFAGLKIQTSLQENTSAPIWNERLILEELFPPLCQRIRIELHINRSFQKSLLAIAYLNLTSISNDKENGFLPTFGPTYLHFYGKEKLEGYVGKVLVSLTTEIQNLIGTESKTVAVQRAPPVKAPLIKDEEVSVFATIFEVSWIDRKYRHKPISFRMTFDKIADQIGLGGRGDHTAHNISKAEKSLKTNKSLYYLEIHETKPRLFISSVLPDLRKRLYNSNLLYKIASELKRKLNDIKDMFSKTEFKTSTPEIDSLMLETLDFIMSSSTKYVDIVSAYNFTATLLDQERLKMCIREMENISAESQTIYNKRLKRKTYQKIMNLYTRIESLIEDPQDCWPYIYLWMTQGHKKVAYHAIHPRHIAYSLVDEESGVDCKKLKTIYFKKAHQTCVNCPEFFEMACRMDLVMSIGLDRHYREMQFEPEGFKFDLQSIPVNLISQEKYTFLCRAHIFQGRLIPGADQSGLCDAFVQIIIGGMYRETAVIKETLSPVWDQTLTFQQIILYGTKHFIRANPPKFLIEVYDRDECDKNEMVGRLIVEDPLMKMIDDTYSVPKLKWYKAFGDYCDVTAEILAAFECLEFTTLVEQDDKMDEDVITAIPPDIKPTWVNYKIEVLFWGVRHLKRINMMPISKPKIVVECANTVVSSENLENSSKYLNFPNAVQCLDIFIPAQKEYAPPLSIQMFDSRCFGMNKYAGTYVTSVEDFFYNPMTSEEREIQLTDLSLRPAESSSSSIIIHSFGSNSDEILKEIPTKKELNLWKRIFSKRKESLRVDFEEVYEDVDDYDWWTKFYASLEPSLTFRKENVKVLKKFRLKIYQNELELQPEFKGFADMLTSFKMYKGKRTGDETVDEENITGTFKGCIKLYRLQLPDKELVTDTGLPLKNGVFQDYPKNIQLRYLLRVYCIRAIGLRPKDVSGKSDPYLYLCLNDKVINDKKLCVMKDVNPVFGRCFEFNAVFPQDHTLIIAVYDWDSTTGDDLIGETKIDLENRFYTKHRAHCGLAEEYHESGYCEWRDQHKPTIILEHLCKTLNLELPRYRESSVHIGRNEFKPKTYKSSGDMYFNKQVLALTALRRWHEMPVVGCPLVPEHVETRSLYDPNKPGIEQETSEMKN